MKVHASVLSESPGKYETTEVDLGGPWQTRVSAGQLGFLDPMPGDTVLVSSQSGYYLPPDVAMSGTDNGG